MEIQSSIGFQEFPADWTILKIGDFAVTKSGGTPSTKIPDYWDGDIPWINSGELNNCFIKYPSRFISKNGLENSATKLLPKNTVVIALTGATTGKVGVLCLECSTNQSVVGILPNEKFDPLFLFFNLIYSRSRILSYLSGAAQPHINKGVVDNFLIAFPTISEQRGIAALLRKIQIAIESQESLIHSATKLKNGLITRMFTEGLNHEPQKQTEIGLIPKSWEIKSLNDVAIYGSIRNGAFINKPTYGKGILYVNVKDVYDRVIIDPQHLQRIDVSEESVKTFCLEEGDILFVRSSLKRGGIGQSCIISSLDESIFYDCHLIKISPNKEIIIPAYLAYYWRSDLGKTELIRRSNTTTMTTINQNNLVQAKLPIPSRIEQQCIVNILMSIDKKMELARAKTSLLNELFRSVSHLLLTGQIRVNEVEF
jgi:type I restriction enzyme, S subunit